MTLSLYPLNGDTEFFAAFADLRNQAGSKRGTAVLNSPQDREGVKDIIVNSKGTANVCLEVQYKDKSSGKIYSDKFTENLPFETKEEEIEEQAKAIINETKDINIIKVCSEENSSIYKRNLNKLKQLVNPNKLKE